MSASQWYKLPTVVLSLVGFYILGSGSHSYLKHLARDPSHELGPMAEIGFFVYLIVGVTAIGIGVHSFKTDRIALPMAVLVYGLVIGLVFAVDDWISWVNRQSTLIELLVLAAVPAVVVWVICKYSPIRQLRPHDG